MNILYDYQTLGQAYGGVSRYFYELYNDIPCIAKDTQILLPVIYANNQYFKNIFDYKKRLIVGNGIINSLFTLGVIMKYRRQGGTFDIIHPTWNNPMYMKMLPCLKKEGKMVATAHDLIHELIMKDGKDIKNNNTFFHQSDGIIAVSENTKKDLLKVYPDLCDKKIKVIYHGNSLTDKSVKLDVPQNYILFVGVRTHYKNWKIVIEAMGELVKTQDDLYLMCAGGGSFSESETALIEKNRLSGRVIQKNVSDGELKFLYENAQCLVYPSLYEGFGIPILEAFSSGCPAVLSNCSCFPEIGGDAALYFDGHDAADLYNKILELMKDNIQRNYFKEKGYERGAQFSWEKAARETYQFYEELIDGR